MSEPRPATDETPASAGKPGGKSALRLWTRRTAEALLIVVIFMGVRVWQQRGMVEGMAPPLQGALLDGKPYALPAHPEKPVLVHFWATWCPVCRAEQGTVNALAEEYPVITVAMSSGEHVAVSKFMDEQHLYFPVINDGDGKISAHWGVKGVPSSFIIGTDGKIRFTEVGYTTGWGLRLRLWLAGL